MTDYLAPLTPVQAAAQQPGPDYTHITWDQDDYDAETAIVLTLATNAQGLFDGYYRINISGSGDTPTHTLGFITDVRMSIPATEINLYRFFSQPQERQYETPLVALVNNAASGTQLVDFFSGNFGTPDISGDLWYRIIPITLLPAPPESMSDINARLSALESNT